MSVTLYFAALSAEFIFTLLFFILYYSKSHIEYT